MKQITWHWQTRWNSGAGKLGNLPKPVLQNISAFIIKSLSRETAIGCLMVVIRSTRRTAALSASIAGNHLHSGLTGRPRRSPAISSKSACHSRTVQIPIAAIMATTYLNTTQPKACSAPDVICLTSIHFAGRRQLSFPVFLFLFFIHLLSSAIASSF